MPTAGPSLNSSRVIGTHRKHAIYNRPCIDLQPIHGHSVLGGDPTHPLDRHSLPGCHLHRHLERTGRPTEWTIVPRRHEVRCVGLKEQLLQRNTLCQLAERLPTMGNCRRKTDIYALGNARNHCCATSQVSAKQWKCTLQSPGMKAVRMSKQST